MDTDRQEYTLDGLQEGVNYSFSVNQTGFSGGGVLPTGPVYARTFTAGKYDNGQCNVCNYWDLFSPDKLILSHNPHNA